ncbi:transcriptional regulator [Salmonella enterica subsp. enterica serovar 1,4,[5],12:i:-]|nr:transcriptional regulator [Salmonella enterica subsp. enterica serovar 1,4,[5],12:i:-]
MESLEKKESTESAGPEITKKMVRERTTKKITFEIDIEKILKYLFFFACAVLVIIYGYKGFMNVYDYFNKQSQPSYKIAVLDMPELRKEFFKHHGGRTADNDRTQFEEYFRTLMKIYRDRGYLIIDATLAVTVPDSVEIVTYMELEDSSEAVQSSSYNAKK